MSTKIALKVGGKRFDVDVEDDFAIFLNEQIAIDFKIDANNEIKTLLQAYIRKSHNLFIQEQNIQDILEECENL